MSKYSCSVCDYTNMYKMNVQRHINRKNKCGDDLHIIEIPTEIKCEYCEKMFSNLSSLNKHLKTCKNKDSEIIEGLKKELELTKFKLAVSEASKTPQTININNTFIVLNGYNDTNVSKLTDRHFLKAINKMCLSVPTMIRDVHFNPNMPENQNIYISNMRNGYVMVYNNETKNWDARPRGEMIDKLINDREYDIQEWLGEGEKYPKAMQKFNEYIEKKEEDGVQKMIKEEIELVLYNNRNMIKNR